MHKSIMAILVGLSVLMPLAAEAGPIQNRIERQERRIDNGVKNGSLSPSEASRLNRQVERLESARNRDARSGGKLTQAEKNRLNRRLNHTSRSIYNHKHN